MSELFTSAGLISLLTLTVLEIILGVDNIIFISIISGKLPKEMQDKARKLGIFVALLVRIILLHFVTWLVGLEEPFFTWEWLNNFGIDGAFSGRDLILLGGGLFLIAKTTSEIHDKLEGEDEGEHSGGKRMTSMLQAVTQIVIIDIVFSFDSILTAVGLVKNELIMIVAVVLALMVMMIFARAIADFVENHPTIKMLALSFLVLIGFLLVVEAFGQHVSKGYVYFAMSFSFAVEILNMRLRKRTLKARMLGLEKTKESTKEEVAHL